MLVLTACNNEDTQSTPDAENQGDKLTVGITQIVEHPALDAAREGFIEALQENGYDHVEIDTQIAQGDMNTNKTIAQKFVGDKVDLILAISTPSAQSVLSETSEIPVLFTAITDPVGAQLVESIESPGGNTTGTSDTHPDAIPNTMKSIVEFFPDAKNVGIIYNAGEQNSEVNVSRAKEVMDELGLTAVEAAISTTAEVKQAAESLIGRSDVIYIPKDNTVVAGLESVIAIANEHDIPLYVGESDSVKRGGFAGYGFEYHDLGYKTGEMAIEVFEGKSPAEISVQYPQSLELVINKKAAEEQGIEITDIMKEKATIIE
ncbi:sugar ABC transporter substrate-binding protein [Bacillus solimangrovi]|uniref:Sugar ABC transporter substrate-binding protein n=2 Tax=Bacillus solimangrovi TaxID=1305675 RepID=A0A1E5LFM6_9BACI|nr:ABC transporter substrate-binding protein [Bacillus solimangrovi]OEH92872.1 sugar ABC transporter substrate-binding protein [Bacillus solimangrovi]